LRYMCL